MRAHVIKDGIVVNTIEVESLDFMPNLIDAEQGGSIGWIYDGKNLTPPDNSEKQAEDIRKQRDTLLAKSDWTQLPDAQVNKTAWATYRQQLKDLPSQSGFPLNVQWPEPPNS